MAAIRKCNLEAQIKSNRGLVGYEAVNGWARPQAGIFHSTLPSTSVLNYGVPITRATYTAVRRTYADDYGASLWAAGSVPDLRVGLDRMLVTADQTGGHI